MHTIFAKKKDIVILKLSMKFQTKLKYESNLKHSSSRSIIKSTLYIDVNKQNAWIK